jgi:hypothetical protein
MAGQSKQLKPSRAAPKIKTRGGPGTRLDERARLSGHPEVNRLASIMAAAKALETRIKEYLNDHRPSCRCPCCVHWKGYDRTPDVRDSLVAMYTVLWSCESLTDEERPMGAAEFRSMRLYDEAFLRELQAEGEAVALPRTGVVE